MSDLLRLDLLVACGFNFLSACFCGVQVAMRLHDGNTKDGSLVSFAAVAVINLLIWSWQVQILRSGRAGEDEDDGPVIFTIDEWEDE